MMMEQIHCARRLCRIAAAVLLLGLAAQADLSEPFGLRTEAAPEGPLWRAWRELQSDIHVDRRIIAQCRAEPRSCPWPAARRFVALVKEGEQHEGLARIGHINRAVNLAIRQINIVATGGVRTKWTSPLTALVASAGDCKQYAVLKYIALAEAGFAPDDLRIIVLTIESARQNHAVVAVRDGARWLVLDNRSLVLANSRELRDYRPLFSLDHRGVRRFVPPSGAQTAGLSCEKAAA
jgi:predicted transglutaminase-like cysteine proteinase